MHPSLFNLKIWMHSKESSTLIIKNFSLEFSVDCITVYNITCLSEVNDKVVQSNTDVNYLAVAIQRVVQWFPKNAPPQINLTKGAFYYTILDEE